MPARRRENLFTVCWYTASPLRFCIWLLNRLPCWPARLCCDIHILKTFCHRHARVALLALLPRKSLLRGQCNTLPGDVVKGHLCTDFQTCHAHAHARVARSHLCCLKKIHRRDDVAMPCRGMLRKKVKAPASRHISLKNDLATCNLLLCMCTCLRCITSTHHKYYVAWVVYEKTLQSVSAATAINPKP